MGAVALTDNGTMYGAIDFYVRAKSLGITPIVGCDLLLTPDISVKERTRQHLVFLCKDFEGYQNLLNLVSIANLDGFYYKPRIDFEHIKPYTKGLICISPGGRGPIASAIQDHIDDKAKADARLLKDLFGADFYLGIQRVGAPMEDFTNDQLKALSEELSIPLVAMNDVYYLRREQSYVKNILRCIQTGRKIEDDTRLELESTDHYFKTAEEMTDLFQDLPEAIVRTVEIADKCQLELVTDQVLLPEYECPDKKSPEVYLEELVWEGVRKKYPEVTQELKDRVKFELDIINNMQYARYFLIIYDFLHYCDDNLIPVGPGRGSAAGSLVAYALNITRIDPIKYNLLFERFLNPERVSMPDIDIDFCIKRRQEVIDYIVKRYGEDHVSQIVTFGTMAARGVVRDVGRVLNVPLADVDRVAKLIPSTPGQNVSISEALETVPDLIKVYDESSEIQELLDVAQQIEGMSRHTSTHAAGVVISRDKLTNLVPLIRNDGQLTTQYPMADLEKLGLLKMDILGLRNLTVLQACVELIHRNHGVKLELNELSFDDEKTYDLLCAGDTIGVFQLESRGMRQLIKDLKPRVFEDIIALLALYRPGPLGSGMVQDFISNKSGETQVKYDLPELEPILKDTYGMILYQEQVMQIASVVGGFTLGQADMLRRAMGKKKKEVMDQMKEAFLDGAEQKQIPKLKAAKIFELCDKFAQYGFNKSHSAAYAMISYQTAYLKANYTMEYMAALLSSVLGNTDKVTLYINDCAQMDITILSPDVNESGVDFTIIDDKSIRFGLGAVKNVGEGAIESIIQHREKAPYSDLSDMLNKVDLKQVNKRVVESLVKCGALDSIGDRAELLATYESCLENAQSLARDRSQGQTALFGNDTFVQMNRPVFDENRRAPSLSNRDRLRMEKEMLGLYITGHPLDDFQDKLNKLQHNTGTLRPEQNREDVMLGGLLTGCRKVITRNKNEMLIGTLEDFHGSVTVLMFQNDCFEEYVDIFQDDSLVYVRGKIRVNQDEITISAEDIELIEKSRLNRTLYIDLQGIEKPEVFMQIKDTCEHFHGSMPVIFKMGDTSVKADQKYWIEENPLCIAQIENIVGSGQLWLQ